MTGAIVPCPFCRCASSVSLYKGRDGIRLDHDCPSCGHRSLDEAQVLLDCMRYMALMSRVTELRASRPDLADVLGKAVEGADEEPMYRTPSGGWYGLTTRRTMRVEPTPEGECDQFDPTFDHYRDPGWQEGCE